jgi:hypothetical protein
VAPKPGPNGVYALNPEHMKRGIELYLDPVIRDVEQLSASYTQAHDEVVAAHSTQAAGWFGGEGNGEVRPATSSFLNEMEWQLRQLAEDQRQLAASLQEYRNALQKHIQGAVAWDSENAERFHAIQRDLEAGR